MPRPTVPGAVAPGTGNLPPHERKSRCGATGDSFPPATTQPGNCSPLQRKHCQRWHLHTRHFARCWNHHTPSFAGRSARPFPAPWRRGQATSRLMKGNRGVVPLVTVFRPPSRSLATVTSPAETLSAVAPAHTSRCPLLASAQSPCRSPPHMPSFSHAEAKCVLVPPNRACAGNHRSRLDAAGDHPPDGHFLVRELRRRPRHPGWDGSTSVDDGSYELVETFGEISKAPIGLRVWRTYPPFEQLSNAGAIVMTPRRRAARPAPRGGPRDPRLVCGGIGVRGATSWLASTSSRTTSDIEDADRHPQHRPHGHQP